MEREQKERFEKGEMGKEELTKGQRYIKKKTHSLQAFRIKIT